MSHEIKSKDFADGERSSHYRSVRNVLLWVLVANVAVTSLKIVLGIWTGALAVLADGFHSLVDSSSNLIGLAAIRLAGKPADEAYPYGYRRYETMGALAIGALLLVAAVEITQGIFERLTSGDQPEFTLLTLGLVILTLPVNIGIVIWETRAGRRLNSELLLADATHTRVDLWVTISVIISVIGSWMGVQWLDLAVAGVVVVMIVRAAFGIIRNAAVTLTDAAPVDSDRLIEVAMDVPGVIYAHHARSRGPADAVFVDMHVKVHAGMSTEQAHAVATEVERRLVADVTSVTDAMVHIEPAREAPISLWDRVAYDLRQIADGMGLGIHDLHVRQNLQGGYDIELHLEMPGEVSLQDAHGLAEVFEERVYAQTFRPNKVITHLEPLASAVMDSPKGVDPQVEEAIRDWLSGKIGEEKILSLDVYKSWEHISVATSLGFPGGQSLQTAHAQAEEIERQLLTRFPLVYRVVVHMEPVEEQESGVTR